MLQAVMGVGGTGPSTVARTGKRGRALRLEQAGGQSVYGVGGDIGHDFF